jgi:hypothetical protein
MRRQQLTANDNDNDGEHASEKDKIEAMTPQSRMRRRRTSWTECWINVGRLGFYLEIPRSDASLYLSIMPQDLSIVDVMTNHGHHQGCFHKRIKN